ncbi:distal membrane-arm assembly complex protein 1 [Myiozetetes cayanensis]|uniref:distal membrane-arm assembly complex protein 1 n=1 Tax=Myiozetetes cayanensis TaxID=478635 RepID=UPI002160712C|nr:distal membrane-arm assembly complex protein 1 [Myiozetetes cayanensis]
MSGAAMPGPGEASPGSGSVPVPASPPPRSPLFGGCLSCRLVCGAGLLLAAAWLYQGPRSVMKRGIPPSMGAIAQITFALSVGAWGIVIIWDPVGKQLPKEP